ncbi:MAG: exonuclease domain-containing protein [Clostridia bacterium]|nr:exonuclease domain-containing protein [Clostridia bacterium]
MTIIVIDLEWNQPLRGRTHLRGLHGEIIQIGAAKINMECEILDTFSIIIKPECYKKINKDVAELTLLTDEDLQGGVPFAEAVESFKNWCGDDFVFLEWSNADIDMLMNNLEYFDMDNSWLPKCYDAQLMFDDMEMQENRQWPLNYALFHFEEKPYGAHDALADVVSTCLILKHLDLEDGLSDDYFRCDYIYDDEPEDGADGESDAESGGGDEG